MSNVLFFLLARWLRSSLVVLQSVGRVSYAPFFRGSLGVNPFASSSETRSLLVASPVLLDGFAAGHFYPVALVSVNGKQAICFPREGR